MGGAGSEVTASTTDVIVESAVFDPVSIRRTAFRYGLRSEASLRFEKGQEPRLARIGADRTAQLLAQWAGGRVAHGVVDTNPVDGEPRRVSFRPARVSRLLGAEIGTDDMKSALARVEIATESRADGASLTAVVPSHRRDIEIEEDVAEEVIRVIGYETLTPRLPDTVMPAYREEPSLFTNRLRDALAGRGLVEVLTNGLIAPQDHARLGLAADDPATIRVANPVTADHSELRRSMLPGLLGVLGRNERQRRDDIAIFEIGALHEWRDGGPAQSEVLAVLLAGNLRAASWAEPARAASLDELKGIVEMLAARSHVDRVEYEATQCRDGVEHPGRTAAVTALTGNERLPLGRVFEVDPRLLAAFEVKAERVAFALIQLEPLRDLAARVPQVRRIDTLPAFERDLAVVVDHGTPAADVERAIRNAAGQSLAAVTLFDRYTGAPLAATEVSLAYRLRFQPESEPLTEQHIDEAVAMVTQALARGVGGRIRSAG